MNLNFDVILGFDVITCPFRTMNEYSGGNHCDTWDIRRDDECKDYFPNQDYEMYTLLANF
ncbi:glycine amidinotransferase-like protein [Leptotrombidium deliense]|uniref:Glycine amidinotransferase-like protein n=1 Tax=Leptotrombidium deliense TaxID=299467 RepID=A0A443SD81_9ACAR|nr:glycine amidinotransferase-like protein [Leptotrombidium deliense]